MKLNKILIVWIALLFLLPFISFISVPVSAVEITYLNVNYYATQDSYVDNNFPAVNYGNYASLSAGSPGVSRYLWTFLNYNFTKPTNYSGVAEANLYLYKHSDNTIPGTNLEMFYTETAWVESTITWNTKPATIERIFESDRVYLEYDFTQTDPEWVYFSGTNLTTFQSFLETELNTAYAGGSYLNTSFVLKNATGNNNMETKEYWSRENGVSAYIPYLWVKYEITSETHTWVSWIYTNNDTYVSRLTPSNIYGNEPVITISYENPENDRKIGYLTFDLSSIPSDATINDITLYLKFKEGYVSGQLTLVMYDQAGTNWSESTLTWGNRPATLVNGYIEIGTFAHTGSASSFIYDSFTSPGMTDIAQSQFENYTKLYFGLDPSQLTYGAYISYCSSEYVNPFGGNFTPYVSISWTSPTHNYPQTNPPGEDDVTPTPENPYAGFDINNTILSIMFILGLILMFSSPALIAVKIKAGDPAVISVVIGIIVFMVGFGLFTGST